MSISYLDDFLIVAEEGSYEYSEISRRIQTLLLDMDADPFIAFQLASSFQDATSKTSSVSFLSAYHNDITPNTLQGVSLVAWITPEENAEHLSPSDFCMPLLLVQKNEAGDIVSTLLEEAIRATAEAKHKSHELLKEFLEL